MLCLNSPISLHGRRNEACSASGRFVALSPPLCPWRFAMEMKMKDYIFLIVGLLSSEL